MHLPLLLGVALLVPAAAAADRARIELLPEARVSGESVVLGQVARLRSEDLALMRRLVHLPVGRAPQPGRVAMLRQDSLRGWIRRQTGLEAEAFALSGATESRVLRTSRQVRGEEIADAALRAVRRWLPSLGLGGEVRVRLLPRDVDAPDSEVRLQVRSLEHAALRRHMVVWVEVWAGAAFLRTVAVPVEVAGLDAVLGSTPEPTEEATADVRGAVATASPDAEPLAVTRGEWVTLTSVAGPVSLESRVEVLQDGRPGQKVRVRSPGARGQVLGRVLAPGQLELVP